MNWEAVLKVVGWLFLLMVAKIVDVKAAYELLKMAKFIN